jgi:hypothetical protein
LIACLRFTGGPGCCNSWANLLRTGQLLAPEIRYVVAGLAIKINKSK